MIKSYRGAKNMTRVTTPMTSALKRFVCLSAVLTLTGCSGLIPTIGPSAHQIESRARQEAAAIEFIDVDESVAERLLAHQSQRHFSQTLGNQSTSPHQIGVGDVLEVSIWEAAPATLFAAFGTDASSLSASSRATILPEQVVSAQGSIAIPFAGRVSVVGHSLEDISATIATALRAKANQPQVIVRLSKNYAATATVVGEFATNIKVPLIAGNDRLLDAIAAAGGARQPVAKTMIQVTRGLTVDALPLDTIIRDPEQNVPLQPGDVVTAFFQPYSFTALGASGKNDEIQFEAQGISLSQAIARSGGLIDSRSNPRGVFIFRLAKADAFDWPHPPTTKTPDGRVPVVFRLDLTDPKSFFVMQSFPMQNKDVLYISNASITETQKFLNVLFSIAYPVLTAKQVGL